MPLPNVDMIKTAIKNLDDNIQNVTRGKPKLRKYIDSLESEREIMRQDIIQIKSEIDGIYTQNQDAITLKDLNSRRAKVVGRISLWLESVEQHDDSTGKEKAIKRLRTEYVILMKY
jgi:predicted  nucleic acid-binding Zn-ribbon protein